MSTGRALYSSSTNRGLYSSTSGRMLHSPYLYNFGNATRFLNVLTTDVTTGTTGLRSDIYPYAYNNATYTWDATPGSDDRAYCEWLSFSTFARHRNFIYARRWATGASKGLPLRYVIKTTTNISSNWRQQSGGGAPYFSIFTTTSDTPDTTNSWVEATYNTAIADPSTSTTTKLDVSITLLDYVWAVTYINAYEPPTTSGQDCWGNASGYAFYA